MEAKVKFAGFCVILTEQRTGRDGKLTNVLFSQLEKSWLKKKIGYTSDVEFENYDGIVQVSRKIVFPALTPEQMLELYSSAGLEFEAETMGALTVEYGWLSAKSYGYFDYYANQKTNAYISPLFTFENFESVEKDSHCMLSNWKWQERLESEIFEALENDNAEYFETVSEFVYNLDQLEFSFETEITLIN